MRVKKEPNFISDAQSYFEVLSRQRSCELRPLFRNVLSVHFEPVECCALFFRHACFISKRVSLHVKQRVAYRVLNRSQVALPSEGDGGLPRRTMLLHRRNSELNPKLTHYNNEALLV
ncbi:MAG: hypothetical protein ACTHLW_13715 [Verrucomicrobiota bacterium]